VFDLTKKVSFQNIESSIKEFRSQCPPDSRNNVVLVGNKLDAEDQRQVTVEEAEEMCQKQGLLKYFETSASKGLNVDEVFFTAVL